MANDIPGCGCGKSPCYDCNDQMGKYRLLEDTDCGDNCCDDIPASECDTLHKKNVEIQDYICRSNSSNLRVRTLFTNAFKKLYCLLYNIINAICCINERVGAIHYDPQIDTYARTSTVFEGHYYRPMNDYLGTTDIPSSINFHFFMDSVDGWTPWNDDGMRKAADQDYRVFVYWCADSDGASGQIVQFTTYSSGEGFNAEMMEKRSRHWQGVGNDLATPFTDTMIVKKGHHVVLNITAQAPTSGNLRIHQVHIAWMPLNLNVGESC